MSCCFFKDVENAEVIEDVSQDEEGSDERRGIKRTRDEDESDSVVVSPKRNEEGTL